MPSRSTLPRLIALGFLLPIGWTIGCGGGDGVTNPPPPPPPPPPSLAVSSAVPGSSFRDATLDVHLIGSGFAAGARAVWSRQNDTAFATTKVRTNSTTLVSPTELVANITIQADAPFGAFGIKVISGTQTNSTSPSFSVNPLIETIDLGAGVSSTARGVNNHGQVVGDRGADASTVQAFLWDGGTITNLGVLPGMTFSYASDINESGQVVGVSGTGTINAPTSERGFVWTLQGGMQALSTLGGAIGSARAINDNGDIVGFSTVSGTSPGHAVVWRNGVIADLQPAFPSEEGRAFAKSAGRRRRVLSTADPVTPGRRLGS